MQHRTEADLLEGLAHVRTAPGDAGTIEMIVARPATDERTLLEAGILDPANGLEGDEWRARGSTRMPDGRANPDAQLTLMNSRVAALFAGARERWPLAGDQLYVDLDLSEEALPPGTRLEVGSAEIEITSLPHTGCAKFSARFGSAALRVANTPEGRRLRLRGVYARVTRRGEIRPGDRISVIERTPAG